MSAAGTWNLTVRVPWPTPHVIKPTLTLRGGSAPTGSMSLEGHTVPIYDGTLDGAEVSWKVDIRSQDGTVTTLEFDGKISGRTISGMVSTPWGPLDFTGSKQPAGFSRFFGLARSKDASPLSSPA
jgi:hypothetical protein